MSYFTAALILFGIFFLVGVFTGEIKLDKKSISKSRSEGKKNYAEFFLSSYQNSLHYQFYKACKAKGVKDINNPEDMKIAVEILRYDQRFAKLGNGPGSVKEQFENVRKDEEKAEKYRAQLAELNGSIADTEIAQYGDDMYPILKSLKEDINNWKQYRGKGISTAMQCEGDNGAVWYIICSGKKGKFTYHSGKKELIAGKPNVYVKKLMDSDMVKVPAKATYTSATVGGITTGGWDIQEEHYETKYTHRGKYCICIGFGGLRQSHDQLDYVWINEAMMKFVEYNESMKWALNKEENRIHVGYGGKDFCDTAASMLGNM